MSGPGAGGLGSGSGVGRQPCAHGPTAPLDGGSFWSADRPREGAGDLSGLARGRRLGMVWLPVAGTDPAAFRAVVAATRERGWSVLGEATSRPEMKQALEAGVA